MLWAKAVNFTACFLPPPPGTTSLIFTVVLASSLFMTTRTTCLEGVRKAVASNSAEEICTSTRTDPGNTNLLQNIKQRRNKNVNQNVQNSNTLHTLYAHKLKHEAQNSALWGWSLWIDKNS